ncbi:MAG TPA: PAS domain S-box protein [Candidatus Methanoperedens sp.]
MRNKETKSKGELLLEIAKLSSRLAEAEETLRAIRSGEVDALVVSTPQGDQVYTLKGAERSYRVLMEKMKEGAVTLSEDDTIFYCNKGFAGMLKKPLEKMIGTGISQFVSSRDRPFFEELLRQGRAGSSKGEVTFLAGDGTAIPAHLSVNTMLLDGLSVAYLVATDLTERKLAEEALQKAHDELEIKVQERTGELVEINEQLNVEIAERKRAEEEVRESEQRYATTLSSIGDAVIVADVNGRITFMNAVAEALTGWTLVEALAKPVIKVFSIMNEDTRSEVESPVIQVLREGTISGHANHTILVRKDGTEIPIDDSGAPIRGPDGRTTGAVLIFRDITGRKRAEEALAHSNKMVSQILESITDGFMAIDNGWNFTYLNQRAASNLGFKPEDLIGHNIWEKFPAIKGTDHEIYYRRAMQQHESQYFEMHGVLTDKWYEIRVYPSAEGISIFWHDITKRKWSEEEIFRINQRLQALMQALPVGVSFSDDPTCQSIKGNPAALAQFEVGPEDNLSASAPDSFAPGRQVRYFRDGREIRDFELPLQRAVAENRFIPPMELEIELPSGRRWFAEASGSPINDMQGNVIGGVAVTMDITGRKRAEEALRKAHDELELKVQERTLKLALANKSIKAERQRFNDILDMLPAYLVLLSPDYHVPFANRFFRERFGESRGFRCFEYLFKRCEPCEICETYSVLKTMAPHHWEWTGPDGRNYDIYDFPFTDVDGSTLILEVGIDITERKRAEIALMENEASYRELTESIDDPFYAMDGDLRYTYWNKASEALTGISAKDAIGRSLYELFPNVKGTKAEQFYIESLKTQQPDRLETEYQLGDRKFIFEINAYPTRTGLSVIAKDITEKKMLEAQLLRAQRMESIGTLAGGMAHDLNNLLTPMMLSLQMLKQRFQDEQSQKLLTILEQNSRRGTDLIKQVLSFTRGVEGERKALQAKYLISEIEKIAKETFPRNIEIGTDVKEDLSTISGDATQLHQVIMNLCVNARDAMPDGGTLSISAENFFIDDNYMQTHIEAKAGSYVVISVSDTGTGIHPRILDRIFDPFFTTKEFGKGTGLGLSTTLAIVKSHGGFIDVQSEVGKGTLFRVYLPAASKTEKQEAQPLPAKPVRGHGETILVVDDEAPIRETTCAILEKYGYGAIAACDGVEAISQYIKNRNDIKLVLIDMSMPFMDGPTCIHALQRIDPDIKIIAVSGLMEEETFSKVENSVIAILRKPYTAESLLENIHKAWP